MSYSRLSMGRHAVLKENVHEEKKVSEVVKADLVEGDKKRVSSLERFDGDVRID